MFTDADLCAHREERNRMVEKQIVARNIRDPKVIAAMRKVPRHLFVAANQQQDAYLDHPVAIACDQTVSQPYMVAVMTEMLALTPTTRVLEIGTGSGYQTAILAEIAAQVYSVERHAPLADSAQQRLEALGYDNITVIIGDGTLGHPEAAPYNAVLITAGAPEIPDALQQQLASGGRLVAPVGGPDVQRLVTIVRKEDGAFHRCPGISCRFVPLIGEQGWEQHP
ncbi:MAG TPA: protein-L-isoaspartate(D-aspartate) O-methyltransferase [Candidatus Hydrogenedentes bacterium]|nr:protein-L-isoaspartate(D-aspartate) O-methyltransferase [Candidatus Hydrogenedentota bacterium]